jgi:iron complex outermembrane receptor protein
VHDDILPLASAVAGRGYFQNVPLTRRQGLEAMLQVQTARWRVYASYSHLDATYRFTGDLASPDNPAADAAGAIQVTPGKRIPLNPEHQFKTGIDYGLTPAWRLGADLIVVGSQFFFGDDANQNAKLPAYAVVNVRSSYQLTRELQLFGAVLNLFDQRYATYGRYFETAGVSSALGFALADPRTVTPAQPLSFYAGLRAQF